MLFDILLNNPFTGHTFWENDKVAGGKSEFFSGFINNSGFTLKNKAGFLF